MYRPAFTMNNKPLWRYLGTLTAVLLGEGLASSSSMCRMSSGKDGSYHPKSREISIKSQLTSFFIEHRGEAKKRTWNEVVLLQLMRVCIVKEALLVGSRQPDGIFFLIGEKWLEVESALRLLESCRHAAFMSLRCTSTSHPHRNKRCASACR